MYGGGRPSRGLLDPREGGATVPHSVNSIARRQLNILGASVDERLIRSKAIVEEDRMGRDGRISGFLPKHSRGMDHAEGSGYGSTERRSSFRDELGAMKMMRSDDAIRGGESHRFREGGVGGRVERASHRSEYVDEPKWVRNGGKYGSSNNYDGVGGLRGSGSDYVSSAGNSGHDILPGFIYESPKRTILDWSLKGSFGLTFDDRRLAEQLGPGTKVFLFDGNSRELYGVFQCMGYALFELDSEVSSSQVRVRAVKDCLPLLEREFKEVLRDNYYTHTKFTAGLSKEQVAKLMQSFRPVDAGRNAHLSLNSSRSSLHSGLVQVRQDFHGVPDEFAFGKEERRRAPAAETRPFNSHTYHGQDGGRFSSKLPVQVHASKGFSAGADDYEQDVIGNLPLESSAMGVLSRGKQQSLRGASSRIPTSQQVNTGRHSDMRLSDGDWREEDARDVVYRKRQATSSTAVDDLKRGNRPSSPSWKNAHQLNAEATGSDVYDRAGKGGYRVDPPYVASTRHVRNDIDLNIPLDMGHGEPSSSHVHDGDSKNMRRRVWEEEDDKGFVASPPKGRSLASRGADYSVASSSREDFEDRSPTSREDHPLLRIQEKSRPSLVPVSSSFSNGKSVKVSIRSLAGAKPLTREKPGLATIRREPVSAREGIHSSRDFSVRTPNVPVVKIKANLLAAPGKGRAERVVTLLNSARPRPRLLPPEDDDNLGSWKDPDFDTSEEGGLRSDIRKRKASVWSRINLPPARPHVKKATLPQGKGRVFSRLGPTVNTLEVRDSNVPHKKKKIYPHQNWVWTRKTDGAADVAPEITELKPVEEDTHVDGSTLDTIPESTEQVSGEPQGWSRKKSQVVSTSSGDEGGNLEPSEPGRCARRKIVRPPIGGRVESHELGEKFTVATPEVDQDSHVDHNGSTASGEHNTLMQQGSPAVMMDVEMSISEAKEGRNSFQDIVSANAATGRLESTPNSLFGESRGYEADNMTS